MATTNTGDAVALFDFADEIAQVSIEVMRYRRRNKASLSDEDKAALETLEGQLDTATADLRAQATLALAEMTAGARQEIAQATLDAQAKLRQIKKIERAVSIATGVLGIALAAVSGDAKGVLAAVKDVRKAVDGDTA
jgi:hypothetical protein